MKRSIILLLKTYLYIKVIYFSLFFQTLSQKIHLKFLSVELEEQCQNIFKNCQLMKLLGFIILDNGKNSQKRHS